MSGRLLSWLLVAVMPIVLLRPASEAVMAAAPLDESPTQSAVTIVAEFVLTQEAADATSQIELAALTSPQEPEKNLLSLKLAKESSPFGFASWLFTLSGDLLPETAQKPGAIRQLHRFLPQYEHTYRASLSYDAVTEPFPSSLLI